MLRKISLLLGLAIIVIASFAFSRGWTPGSVEVLLMIAAIIGFAVVAAGWAINRDV